MNIGVNYLREHITPDCSLHYVYEDGGGIAQSGLDLLKNPELVRKIKEDFENSRKEKGLESYKKCSFQIDEFL